MNLALFHLKINIIKRLNAAERFSYVLYFQQDSRF
jgi:hypothetical protein